MCPRIREYELVECQWTDTPVCPCRLLGTRFKARYCISEPSPQESYRPNLPVQQKVQEVTYLKLNH
jgi:hypothetical protein